MLYIPRIKIKHRKKYKKKKYISPNGTKIYYD